MECCFEGTQLLSDIILTQIKDFKRIKIIFVKTVMVNFYQFFVKIIVMLPRK